MPVVVIYDTEMKRMQQECGGSVCETKLAETQDELKKAQAASAEKDEVVKAKQAELEKANSELEKANKKVDELTEQLKPKSAFIVEASKSGTVVKLENIEEDPNGQITELKINNVAINGTWVRVGKDWLLVSDVVLAESDDMNIYFKYQNYSRSNSYSYKNRRTSFENGVQGYALKATSLLSQQQLINNLFVIPAAANQ